MPDIKSDSLVADELLKCNKCGFCLQNCPTYRATRMEGFVARGRNAYVQDVLAGRTELTADMQDPLFECLLCGACTTACLTKVKTDEVMVRAREAWHEAHGQPAVQRYIFDELLPNPERMTRIMRLLTLGKRTGMADLAHRLGVLRWINARLDGAAGLVETMPKTFLRDRLARMGFRERQEPSGVKVWGVPRQTEKATGPSVLYFIGCGTNYQLPRIGEAAMQLLLRGGCEITVAQNVCCGLPAYSYGDREAARSLARKNLELLKSVRFDRVVTECGSCSSFLKKYPKLLEGDEELAATAAEIAERTWDINETLARLPLPSAETRAVPVTYHDPCHLVRGQGITEEPRKLLTDVGGVDLREMTEANWCCGGAGSYNIMHPELSLEILDRKMSRIAETGAGIVATSCPACIIQLSYGARRKGMGTRVKHVAEVVAESLGIRLGE